jgi:hypothetical protein
MKLRITMAALAILTMTAPGRAQAGTSSVPYVIPNLGAATIQTTGTLSIPIVGYARLQPTAMSTTPAGAAFLDFRQNGVLVSETGIAESLPITAGRTFVEISGAVNTGLAMANTSAVPIAISFVFTDRSGNSFGPSSFTLNGNAQVARFLNEPPFNIRTGFVGTLTFTATGPVAVTAIRTLVNQRGEFLFTAQPVVPLPPAISAGSLLIPHFAFGGGWKTQVVLVNTTDDTVTGTLQFFGEGTGTVQALPLTINLNGLVASTFAYTIPGRSAATLETITPATTSVQVGSIQIAPSGNKSPGAYAVLSLSTNGVTVSQTAIEAQRSGFAFRAYAELTSAGPVPGAIQSAVAIANNSITPIIVNFTLTTLTGADTGLTAGVSVPGSGHVSLLLSELFPSLDVPFRGVLRVSSFSSFALIALRTRVNEQGNFLMTSTVVSNESSSATTAELIFPQIVDGGGFSTLFTLFSGITSQNSTGLLNFFDQTGRSLNLVVQ